MNSIKRSLGLQINQLALKNNKMALISGPRQVGKTTLAKSISKEFYKSSEYFNWDNPEFRKIWQKTPVSLTKNNCTVFDEIHKAKNWKTTLKGIYDQNPKQKILVTGSTRIETFRRGGDSMMGRYLHFRLHPLSLGEIHHLEISEPETFIKKLFSLDRTNEKTYETLTSLFEFGGFPENFVKKNKQFLRLWQKGRIEKLVRTDLRDLSKIEELGQIETLCSLLPEKVGSPLSIQSLSEDMEVTYNTLKSWMSYLKTLYFHFEIKPFSKKINRSIKKQGKIYLWDYSPIKDKGARLENLVASHLLKAADVWTDLGYGDFELCFFRDKEKREVDFVLTKDQKPWILVEVKTKADQFSKNISHFSSQWDSIELCVILTLEKKVFKKIGENQYAISMDRFFYFLP